MTSTATAGVARATEAATISGPVVQISSWAVASSANADSTPSGVGMICDQSTRTEAEIGGTSAPAIAAMATIAGSAASPPIASTKATSATACRAAMGARMRRGPNRSSSRP